MRLEYKGVVRMNGEEHTKEQMVEDLAASLAGGMEE